MVARTPYVGAQMLDRAEYVREVAAAIAPRGSGRADTTPT